MPKNDIQPIIYNISQYNLKHNTNKNTLYPVDITKLSDINRHNSRIQYWSIYQR